jgi:hypothetical protein
VNFGRTLHTYLCSHHCLYRLGSGIACRFYWGASPPGDRSPHGSAGARNSAVEGHIQKLKGYQLHVEFYHSSNDYHQGKLLIRSILMDFLL